MLQDYSPASEHRKPQETEIDLCPSPSSTSPLPSSKFPVQADQIFRHEQTPRRNMQELEEMLGLLDQPEYTNLVINGSNYRFDDFGRQKSNASSSSNERKTSTNSQTTKFPIIYPDDSTKNTKIAAEMAAQQLDDLLVSLNQFKIGKQESTTLSDRSTTSSSRDQVDATREVNTNNNGHGGSHAHVDAPRSTAVADRPIPKPVSDWVCDQARIQSNAPNTALSSMLSSLSSELAQQGAITASKGFCYACKKPIVGMLISAMDKEWHPDHFTCVGCGICLVREDFYERDNQPYCLDCHAKLFSPKCGYCGEAILEKCIVALSRAWHPDHFFCYSCHQGFDGNVTVHEHENRIYCSSCYLEHFGTRCSGCNQPITDSYITALDVPWHRTCFVCQDCGKVLSGSTFHEIDDLPYCDSHYYTRRGLLCIACSKPITGRCVNALGRRYHPEHFTCAYCLQPLQTGTFKEHSNKPYCHQCFEQLFG
ncbi:Paxillin a [Paragonimus heterotremus]|uniref:Paxillin a n=1 Tax=Paragonimus heterotremus TaxID=100268 RepID=A0A8J4SM70_9TREM|nr:Paxillin a [Paragonimus heterotremus]